MWFFHPYRSNFHRHWKLAAHRSQDWLKTCSVCRKRFIFSAVTGRTYRIELFLICCQVRGALGIIIWFQMTFLGRRWKTSDKRARSLADTKSSSFSMVVALVSACRNNLLGEVQQSQVWCFMTWTFSSYSWITQLLSSVTLKNYDEILHNWDSTGR